ncbi:hypothetical protein BO83DRAFT_379865 [Aspergillus eucalypticola CBS 122712]|uniref:Uncharacterized protein n=1 Tax=Aspergillus eucalypticola (strain CBS 122712 / IBT 29274) TaxID=1448314 RepID=A0A317V8M1_ASPEC|nr:uncharacterized protein BO83DRAFT_379865 [Aspergillus eucalypticola CBS 122712]PWY69347.1 hypothetical protein BO83DRAFT_379865 [Aspergillus eucalypticola CBS 122712]
MPKQGIGPCQDLAMASFSPAGRWFPIPRSSALHVTCWCLGGSLGISCQPQNMQFPNDEYVDNIVRLSMQFAAFVA